MHSPNELDDVNGLMPANFLQPQRYFVVENGSTHWKQLVLYREKKSKPRQWKEISCFLSFSSQGSPMSFADTKCGWVTKKDSHFQGCLCGCKISRLNPNNLNWARPGGSNCFFHFISGAFHSERQNMFPRHVWMSSSVHEIKRSWSSPQVPDMSACVGPPPGLGSQGTLPSPPGSPLRKKANSKTFSGPDWEDVTPEPFWWQPLPSAEPSRKPGSPLSFERQIFLAPRSLFSCKVLGSEPSYWKQILSGLYIFRTL